MRAAHLAVSRFLRRLASRLMGLRSALLPVRCFTAAHNAERRDSTRFFDYESGYCCLMLTAQRKPAARA